MRSLLLVSLLSAIVIVAFAEEKYTTRYDNINLDEILSNKRLLRGYTNCLLEKGPCSPDGAELKRVLPDAIETNCVKCNDKQRDGARTILRHLINKEPEIWKELAQKYDPNGTYTQRYREEAKKDGINL